MNYRFVGGTVTPDIMAQVLAFWEAEGALPPAVARERVQQLIAIATDDSGAIRGVATLYAVTPTELRQPMYQYRTYVARNARKAGIAKALLQLTFAEIEQRMTDPDNAEAIGLLLEIPGELADVLSPYYHWPDTGFSFIGKRPDGSHLRVRYFEGVKLKNP